MPPQMAADTAQHAHPIIAMMGGIVMGLILGAVSMYYWEEMLQLQALQQQQAQAQAQSAHVATTQAQSAVNPLGSVKLNPFE